jgi:succinate dehydrogenase / fumarate reductase cytochrome b subunit
MLGGVRYLVWDTLHGFEQSEREMLSLATIVGSILFTLIVWAIAYLAMGGSR